ncbi:hypothetical protein CEXT_552231 [Caerostris extrusa]|uniref:Uncharacterized protein n=1 Tax=Caerostris extrusa TaxID=172846 RepID=A0AAV4WJX1_CAEEX|nr:hypothetical protein CEXT_552231 [Caerostris extrusa]
MWSYRDGKHTKTDHLAKIDRGCHSGDEDLTFQRPSCTNVFALEIGAKASTTHFIPITGDRFKERFLFNDLPM